MPTLALVSGCPHTGDILDSGTAEEWGGWAELMLQISILRLFYSMVSAAPQPIFDMLQAPAVGGGVSIGWHDVPVIDLDAEESEAFGVDRAAGLLD